MIHSIEFAQIESKVVAGLRSGTDALNKLNAMMKLDDVEKLMEDTRDAIEYQQVLVSLAELPLICAQSYWGLFRYSKSTSC